MIYAIEQDELAAIIAFLLRHEKTRGGFLRAGVTNFSMMPLCQCFARRVKAENCG
jgi:hypothetical protein